MYISQVNGAIRRLHRFATAYESHTINVMVGTRTAQTGLLCTTHASESNVNHAWKHLRRVLGWASGPASTDALELH